MVHAALLLLMLEAANARPRFTISLKRSTPNLQLSTSRRPITPSLPLKVGTQESGVTQKDKHSVFHLSILRAASATIFLFAEGPFCQTHHELT